MTGHKVVALYGVQRRLNYPEQECLSSCHCELVLLGD